MWDLNPRPKKTHGLSTTTFVRFQVGTQSAPCRSANWAGPWRVLTFFSFVETLLYSIPPEPRMASEIGDRRHVPPIYFLKYKTTILSYETHPSDLKFGQLTAFRGRILTTIERRSPGGQRTSYFRIDYGRELVPKPEISLKKSWAGGWGWGHRRIPIRRNRCISNFFFLTFGKGCSCWMN